MPAESQQPAADRLDDDDYPAYTMGRAAELIASTPGFLRSLGEAGLITDAVGRRSPPLLAPSAPYGLPRPRAGRPGDPIEAACRIISLEDRLDEALRVNEELRPPTGSRSTTVGAGRPMVRKSDVPETEIHRFGRPFPGPIPPSRKWVPC